MITTIILALLLIGSIVAGFVWWRQPTTRTRTTGYRGETAEVPNEDRVFWLVGSAGSFVVFLLVFVLSTFVVVSTRNIGVVTTFGRPVGTLSNGLHFTWPWQSVTELDGSIQIDWHKDSDPNGDNHGDAIVVRLGNQSNAWVDASVRWEMKLDAADDLFLQYKTFDNIRTNLITRNLQTALNEVFAAYNPLATINSADPTKAPVTTESALPALAAQATKIMQATVGDKVQVFEVQIPTIAFSGDTQDKIEKLNSQKAATAVAIESQATAEAQAKANEILSRSLNQDPNVLVSKCLDIVKDKGGSVFGCWPGTGAVPTLQVPQ